MSRQEGQKAKLLVLKNILERKTDEDHPLSVPQLIRALEAEGIRAERKSIYNDIEALRASGVDVELSRGRGGGYYLGSRTFELPELKLLVDAVQASQFITKDKSKKLIRKLEGLTSEAQARKMQRQVFVSGRVKTMNESIYYNVDALHEAIARDRQVQFQYLEWDLRKRRVPRRGGQIYQASPWVLAWENANYYLVAYTGEGIRHYRVDKMKGVRQTELPRQGKAEFSALDLAAYTRKMFGMYGGREEKVTLKCANSLVGVMLDRFGTEAILVPQADETFHLTVPVAVSPQFLGWVCGFGGEVRVIGPAAVRREMGRLVQSLADTYLPLQE
ncbi:WYL domain-containing protein [Fournierella massiliensis]|nr:WYL domain-containing protein [Fournierella massiliensis]MCF2557463.1 WYL domain-containing protein [Fournierella massiliensis]